MSRREDQKTSHCAVSFMRNELLEFKVLMQALLLVLSLRVRFTRRFQIMLLLMVVVTVLTVFPKTVHKGAEGMWRYSSTLSLTSALD